MDKTEIAAAFEEIAVLLELRGDNPFKVRAYLNAARTLETLDADLGALIAAGTLTSVKGVGKDLAERITELHTTGRLAMLDELRASTPPGLIAMLDIPGVGRFAALLSAQVADRQRVAGELERVSKEAAHAARERAALDKERATLDKEREKETQALRQQLEALRAIERGILEREEKMRRRQK